MGLENVSWDDLRIFVVAARSQSFRKAAAAVKTSSSTVIRHIERLERRLGVSLFDRLPEGVRLTREGAGVLDVANRMEQATIGLRRHIDRSPTVRGIVRCAVTEGLGTFWMMPRLSEFARTNPYTLVDLRCTMNPSDVLRLESDVAVQLVRPQAPDLKVIKLGRLHAYPFAAQSYLDIYGAPRTREELAQHRLVDQVSPQVPEGLLASLLGLRSIEGIVALRTNLSSSHFYAVESGVGIGFLPTYAIPLGARIVPLDVGVCEPVDIWLTFHPDIQHVPRVRLFIDWLRSIFDPARFPWFSDDFIHPNDLRSWSLSRPERAVPPFDGALAHPHEAELWS
ncbi:LysR family transcriptional regulator [Alsobacter soli]|nr:LysR family transcriptional regulator [Alsobacter soli]